MPAKAGARVVRHKAKGFGSGGADDFIHINIHFIRDGFHFVDKANVHSTVDVFQ